MAKKPKAIYAPGELDRVRGKLGNLDESEAKRMARLLGGEVGVEKTVPPKTPPRSSRSRNEKAELVTGAKRGSPRGMPKRRVELTSYENEAAPQKTPPKQGLNPLDDPEVQINASYFERVKMDQFAAQGEFEIKTFGQVFLSMVSLFSRPRDYVSPRFVTQRMGEYYKKMEQLVLSTRSILPRNNQNRSEQLRKTSPLAFSILDAMRYWNIERIATELARIQAHPREVTAADFGDILQAIYKPLFIFERLDSETHIKGAYKLLYRILISENPMDIAARDRYQEFIRNAIIAFDSIRKDIQYLLYPLLLKLLSSQWLPYELFFIDRRNRFMHFINATEKDQLIPVDLISDADIKALENGEGEGADEAENAGEPGEDAEDNSPEAEAKRAARNAMEAERKAVDRGFAALETLFPQAGWDRLDEYPDLYPYFANIFDLKRGYDLIAPTDPLIQVAVLVRILEELFFGIRYISFGTVMGPDGTPAAVNDVLGKIINNWTMYIEVSFVKEYLPRLAEYCRILESTSESRTSNYAKRILNELHWTKRLYFFPYYKFESLFPPPFQKRDISPFYPEIRELRKYLAIVAAGIDQGNKTGGAEQRAPCDGIDNPWDSYVFQVPNPVSVRLNALLSNKKKNNAALIFFALAVTTVLDYLVNNENSWAYALDRPGPLFRTVNGEGVMPQFGVESLIDADAIFKEAMKQRELKQEK
ncbi:MAG: hypothetical protein LBT95_04505 [Treponema sp.]|jgi:hypothetical protein|nr:hypothetical protein [Treponema sp.]